MSSLKVLGIMSGTSLDAVDFVKIKIHKKNLKCEFHSLESFPFPIDLKKKLFRAVQNELLVSDLALLHFELGQFYAHCFKKLPTKMKSIDLIGLHGQTIFHKRKIATLQIGEPSFIAEASGRKVIANFRAADIVMSGEGAPLTSFFHQVMFGDKKKNISIHNLGGISNLSLVIKGKLKLSFDTGPANMLIDEDVRQTTQAKKLYDKDGLLAQKGKVNSSLLAEMLQHDYFNLTPPKSCGREEFGLNFYNQFKDKLAKITFEDRIATLTELTVISIVKSYRQYCNPMPQQIIFCGGGAKNKYLMRRIDEELEGIKVTTTEDYGWPVQSIEAAAFAFLAACREWKIKSNLPQATKAKKSVLLGQITEL